jgi:hypothetical protein
MRNGKTPGGGMTRVAGPPSSRARAGANVAALTRRSRAGRLLCGAAVSVAALWLGVPALAAPAAQASQRLPAASTATYPYKFSRIAWTGSDEVIAATDSHGDLYYFWQASGSTTWHKQLVAGAITGIAYTKPSIAAAGTTVYIAAVDGSGDLYYFTKTGTASWHEVLLSTAGSMGKYQAPSITTGDGSVLISVGNTGGDLDSFTLASGSSSWDYQTVAAGLFGPSSVTIVFDSLDSEYLGLITASSEGTLYFWWEHLAGPGWNQQTVASPGAAGSYTGGSVAASNADIVIAAATTTGAVDSFTQPIGASGWTQQTVTTSGGPYTSPQVAWTGFLSGTSSSYDVITAANHAGALRYWWVADGSGLSWSPETIAANGTQAVYANPGISVTSTSVVVTAINTKPGDVMYWFQGLGTNPWYKQVVATG